MFDMDHFTGQANDPFNGAFLVTIVKNHDIAAFQWVGNWGRINPRPRLISGGHAGAADHGNRTYEGSGDTDSYYGGTNHPQKKPEGKALPEGSSEGPKLSHF